ncbi:MAG: enoyl-CoA hydratase [Sulfobacillus benefaciens]|uniref:short-chain-enoyl-CoA hydratase n=1 Tax=Sulfobacillus benefaciens TaxID=453960 RepID=A0A2T2XKD5_9FIRM|nr:MAG: enoyl-CoA hydratase [Sulfobacillus benefaciens]
MSEPVLLLDPGSGPVRILRLNRPAVLNALNSELMEAIVAHLDMLDKDDAVSVVIITGQGRAFAAGADISELKGQNAVTMLTSPQINRWENIRRFSKPLIAAVKGYALGGGMELVMACDMVIAAEGTRFGQPEIKIGVMPGAGGTQRLTKAIGKVRAMEMVLTGKTMTADEAYAYGLINRVVPVDSLEQAALELAQEIAAMPQVAVRLAKESVLTAMDTPLEEGLKHERKLFSLLFATEDQQEGMAAFLEKRSPQFRGR